MSGIKWGATKNELRKAEKHLQAGEVASARVIIRQQIEHIEKALNDNMLAKRERINNQRRERLLAKMERRKD